MQFTIFLQIIHPLFSIFKETVLCIYSLYFSVKFVHSRSVLEFCFSFSVSNPQKYPQKVQKTQYFYHSRKPPFKILVLCYNYYMKMIIGSSLFKENCGLILSASGSLLFYFFNRLQFVGYMTYNTGAPDA